MNAETQIKIFYIHNHSKESATTLKTRNKPPANMFVEQTSIVITQTKVKQTVNRLVRGFVLIIIFSI